MDHRIIRLTDEPKIKEKLALWFHEKWGVPLSAYRESMTEAIATDGAYPQWYAALEGERIIGGAGVIDNDFHPRHDLSPNLCALFVEKERRGKGVAGELLDFICADMSSRGVKALYLITDHETFYEKYGWSFFCCVKGDGEDTESRMYIKQI